MTVDLPLLLDTHVWLWIAQGGPVRVRPHALHAVEDAGAQGMLRVSVMSIWEVALLESKGRLALPMGAAEWVRRALDRPDFQVVSLEPDVAIESCNLPGELHPDPADRFLIATARVRKFKIVTRDQRILQYARQGHVQALRA